jgi:hypothetical protein
MAQTHQYTWQGRLSKLFLLTSFSGLLAGSIFQLHAEVITPDGPWQTVTTPVTVTGEVITSSTTTDPGNAYWNNPTADATLCANVGCFVTGASYFAGDPNSPNLENPVYLGQNDGSPILDFYWSGGPVTAQLLGEVAGLAGRNWLGWYEQGATLTAANRGTAWDVVFTGDSGVGTIVNFTPTQNFGLWFLADFASSAVGVSDADIIAALDAGGRFTESSRNGPASGTTNQYFAAFARSAAAAQILPTDFWIGVEDVFLANADRDFNDMLLRLTVVPEPGYYVILSLGLAGIWLLHRRYIRKGAARGLSDAA